MARYTKGGTQLAPLRVCPHHGQSFRSWNAHARGPCCRQEDATFGVDDGGAFVAALDRGLLAYQRSLSIELDERLVAARKQARSAFTFDYDAPSVG